MNGAYYNEFDPRAAAWLRELIKQGHIAPGDVDERDMWDVSPDDVKGYTQAHWCAGIGVWSYALRNAGWEDERPVWSMSLPCQPFSQAGQGLGFADPRHLWPAARYLISECRPGVIIGEQVASKDGLAWLDLVSSDMEAAAYAFGAVDICAAGFGAPHIRQRSYWVAYDDDERLLTASSNRLYDQERSDQRAIGSRGVAGGLVDASHLHRRQCPNLGAMGGSEREVQDEAWKGHGETTGIASADVRSLPTNGHWRDVDWLGCRDERWRPVEPGTFPLAHGSPARVGRLRGYGNAIVAPVATGFIEAVIETLA